MGEANFYYFTCLNHSHGLTIMKLIRNRDRKMD